VIDFRIRRRAEREDAHEVAERTYGELVAEIVCMDCLNVVCIAQCDDWPPHGPVTLHIGTDWTDPVIADDAVYCGDCGGLTTTMPPP
jgi:hypothetical protein